MRAILLIIIYLLLFQTIIQAQSNCAECNKFKVVALYDFFPSPQTPDNDKILLLLTLTEDLEPSFNRFYVDMVILNSHGDTITQSTGVNQTLPEKATDTIPYLLTLHPNAGITDFPDTFEGSLYMSMDNVPPCPSRTTCQIDFEKKTTGTNPPIDPTQQLLIFPNPAPDQLQVIAKQEIITAEILNGQGKRMKQLERPGKSFTTSIASFSPGLYLLKIRLEDNTTLSKWIQKI